MVMRFLSPAWAGNTLDTGPRGGVYICDANDAVHIPDDKHHSDVAISGAIGQAWIQVSTHGAGPSSKRPLSPPPGSTYVDDDLRAYLIFDGDSWRNAVDGSYV